MWKIDEMSVRQIVRLVDSGDVGLPQFQRDEVWTKKDWIPFLRTLLLGRPTGTLLFLESGGARALAPRKLETAPPLNSKVSWLLLDGQQRTTTLYRATSTSFGTRPRFRVIVRVKAAIEEHELKEEHLELRKYGEPADHVALARAGEVDLATLIDDGKRESWRYSYIRTHYDEDDELCAERFAADLRRVLPGLLDVQAYKFPVLKVEADTPLSVVAEIFEGINRRGRALDTFDLMVARLYQPLAQGDTEGLYFDLREQWQTALDDASQLKQLGVTADHGMLPLQLIALQVSRNPSIRGTVTGLTGADVLDLKPEQVIGAATADIPDVNLVRCVQALEDAAAFLVKHCGVVTANLLPQQAMLLPIADQMLQPDSSRLSESELQKWFFSAGLNGDFYGSVNSYAFTHAEQLRSWALSGVTPTQILELTKAFVSSLNLRGEFRRDGTILGRTIMAFLVQVGASDWVKNHLLVRQCDPIEFHHIVPEKRLAALKFNKSEQRPIAGMTPISKSANASVRKENPKTVVTDLGSYADLILTNHLIDGSLLETAYDSKAKFDTFCRDRERRIKERLIAFLDL